MVQAMKSSLENLESITDRINKLVGSSFNDMDKTMENLESVTSNIADNNAKITDIFNNLESISKDISEAKPGEAISSANEALKETKLTVESLRETLTYADESFAKLNKVLDKASGGEGSLAKLLSDPKLYENYD
jgi:phospholipid/cholesterol/gamma-HCH transport system substrate-binding protein